MNRAARCRDQWRAGAPVHSGRADHELDDQLQRALRGERAQPRVVENLARRQIQVSGTTVSGNGTAWPVVLRDVTDLRRWKGGGVRH